MHPPQQNGGRVAGNQRRADQPEEPAVPLHPAARHVHVIPELSVTAQAQGLLAKPTTPNHETRWQSALRVFAALKQLCREISFHPIRKHSHGHRRLTVMLFTGSHCGEKVESGTRANWKP